MMRVSEDRIEQPGGCVGTIRRTAHDVAEKERLMRSYGYADAIRRRPELIIEAQRSLDDLVRDDAATLGQRLWHVLLREPMETILLGMTGDDAEGRLLRSNNPFSMMIGQTDVGQRRRTWRKASAIL